MYGLLDNLDSLGLELELPFELFKTSFNPAPKEEPTEEDSEAEPIDMSASFGPKVYTCPVCKVDFDYNIVRTTKIRLKHTIGVRPVYYNIEPLFYGVLMCTRCGYAALQSNFESIIRPQADRLSENLRPLYSNFMAPSYPLVLTVEMAIERYKYALLSALFKKSWLSEKAFIMMKIAWLYEMMGDTENELLFVKHSYDYFTKAYTVERFPLFGLSQGTVAYILAEFASKLGDKSSALKHLGTVILDPGTPERLKELARDLKHKLVPENY